MSTYNQTNITEFLEGEKTYIFVAELSSRNSWIIQAIKFITGGIMIRSISEIRRKNTKKDSAATFRR